MKRFITVGIIIVAVLLMGCSSSRDFDAMSHLTVEFSGLDGQGSASVAVVDMAAWESAAMQAAGLAEATATLMDFLAVASAVDAEVSPDSGLYNGDSVTITLTVNEDIASEYGFRVTGGLTRNFTVAGLTEVETVDVFEGVELITSGTSPFLTVEAVNNSSLDFVPMVSYTVVHEPGPGGFAVGDEVVVQANLSRDAENAGIVALETYQSFIIENAPAYVQDSSQLRLTDFEQIMEAANLFLMDELENSGNNFFANATGDNAYNTNATDIIFEFSIQPPEIASTYLISRRQNAASWNTSAAVVVFRVEGSVERMTNFARIAGQGSSFANDIIYIGVAVPDLMFDADGVLSMGEVVNIDSSGNAMARLGGSSGTGRRDATTDFSEFEQWYLGISGQPDDFNIEEVS